MNSREKQPLIAGIGVCLTVDGETSVTIEEALEEQASHLTEERRSAGRGVALHRGPARRGAAPIRGGSLPRGGPRDG